MYLYTKKIKKKTWTYIRTWKDLANDVIYDYMYVFVRFGDTIRIQRGVLSFRKQLRVLIFEHKTILNIPKTCDLYL